MDATLNYYMKLTPSQAFEVMKNVIDEIKNVNGTFISIWLNESLNYTDIWCGWDNIYDDMINEGNSKINGAISRVFGSAMQEWRRGTTRGLVGKGIDFKASLSLINSLEKFCFCCTILCISSSIFNKSSSLILFSNKKS